MNLIYVDPSRSWVLPKNEIKMSKTGIYFLANDAVIDNAIAMLNSLRMFEPEVDICCIPFNQDMSKIRKLSADYNFEILDEGIVSKWD